MRGDLFPGRGITLAPGVALETVTRFIKTKTPPSFPMQHPGKTPAPVGVTSSSLQQKHPLFVFMLEFTIKESTAGIDPSA